MGVISLSYTKRTGSTSLAEINEVTISSLDGGQNKVRYAASTVQNGAVITYDPYSIPNHKELISRGQYAGSDLYVSAERYQGSNIRLAYSGSGKYPGDSHTQYSGGGLDGDPGVYLTRPPAPSLEDISKVDNKARTRMASQVAGIQHSFQGGVFLGELGEAIQQIRHPLKSLTEGLSSYLKHASSRASKQRTIPRRNKAVADTWLEFQYGWLPLIQDIKDGAKALANLAYRPPRRRAYANAAEPISSSSSEGSVTIGGSTFTYLIKNEVKLSAIYRAVVSLPSDRQTAIDDFGVGFRSFVPTVWNLIPYSFIADYFTNIGDIADSLSINYSGVRFATRGLRCDSVSTLTVTSYLCGGVTTSWMLDRQQSISLAGPAVWTRTLMERKLYNASFTPSFQFEAPSLLSKKWINLAALFTANRSAVQKLSNL